MITQIFGILAFLALAISFWMKDKRKLLIGSSLSAFFYSIHYFLLNANSGVIINIIGIFRGVFFSKDKISLRYKNTVMIILIAIYTVSVIIFWQNIFSILPLIAESLNVILYNKSGTKLIRMGNILISTLWLIYNIAVGSYAGVITSSLFIISTIIAILKLDNGKYKEKI